MADEGTQGLRDRLLDAIWDEIRGTTPENVGNYAAAANAIRAGADPADLAAAMTYARYEMAFGLLYLLDRKHEAEAYDGDAGWMLVDAILSPGDPYGAIAGGPAPLHGLHEELLSADPSGTEGADFLLRPPSL